MSLPRLQSSSQSSQWHSNDDFLGSGRSATFGFASMGAGLPASLRAQGAHLWPGLGATRSLSHGLFDEERLHSKRATSRAGAPWSTSHPHGSLARYTIWTGEPWTRPGANQIDRRCEAMRHAQTKLPEGSTALERKDMARRLALLPYAPPRGLAKYQVPEASRFALASSIPQSHDTLYRRSSMPVGSSCLASH